MADSKRALLGEAYPAVDPRFITPDTVLRDDSKERAYQQNPFAPPAYQPQGSGSLEQGNAWRAQAPLDTKLHNYVGANQAAQGAYEMPGMVKDFLTSVYNSDYNKAGELAPMVMGIFAGPRAKRAPLPHLRTAAELHGEGATRAEVWKETGWDLGYARNPPATSTQERLPSGVTISEGPKWEIPDYKLKARPNLEPGTDMVMGDAWSHPEYFANYPHARRMPYALVPEDVAVETKMIGGYSPHNPRTGRPLMMMAENYPDVVRRIAESDPALAPMLKEYTPRGTFVHENTHVGALEEGFDPGTNINHAVTNPAADWLLGKANEIEGTFRNDFTRFRQEYYRDNPSAKPGILRDQVIESMWRETQDPLSLNLLGWAQAFKKAPRDQQRAQAYLHNAGETNARTADKRKDMSEGELLETPYWEMHDIPEYLQWYWSDFGATPPQRARQKKR